MKFKKAPKPFKLVLVTESRDELCSLAENLFTGMNPDLFTDKTHPVIVTIRGAYGSGKTVFPDIIREACVPDAVCTAKAFHENHRLDETYTGTYLGKPFDFAFINCGYIQRFKYSHPAIRKTSYNDGTRGITFIGLRENGGMTFIHNDDGAVMKSSIDIWIEDGMNTIESTCEKSRLAISSLKGLFANQVQGTWRRYLEISVYDPRLFGDERFMQKLEECKGIISIERTLHTHPKRRPDKKLTPTQIARRNKAMEDMFTF